MRFRTTKLCFQGGSGHINTDKCVFAERNVLPRVRSGHIDTDKCVFAERSVLPGGVAAQDTLIQINVSSQNEVYFQGGSGHIDTDNCVFAERNVLPGGLRTHQYR